MAMTTPFDRAAFDISGLIERRKPNYSLEAPFYRDQAIYDLDLEAIWSKHWVHVGVEAEVPKAGDWVTVNLGRNSIIVVRGADGEVRAFHNVCRHRGARILHEPRGSAAKLVCGYHQWAYDLSGGLSFAEHIAPDVDRSCLGLKPVAIRSLCGLLFICLADKPPADFDDMAAAVEPYLAPHDLRNARLAFEEEVVVAGNWKATMENNRECYHCNGHPELLQIFFQFFAHGADDVKPRQKSYYERYRRIQGEMNAIWEQEGLPHRLIDRLHGATTAFRLERLALDQAGESYTVDTKAACRKLMGRFTQPRLGALSLHTQPNSWNHFLADHAVVFDVLPLAPDKSLLRTKWLVHKDAVEGVDYDLDNLTKVWRKTNSQDATFVCWQQTGVDSPAYEPGPLSPNENQVEAFLEWYMDRLSAFTGGARPGQAMRSAAAR